MINVALIGYGYWGTNLLRNFMNTNGCTISHVVDGREERLAIAKKLYPSISTTTNIEDVFASEEVNAVVIATPVFGHYPLAKKALEAGKHVLVEKPFTAKYAEALELIELAASKNLCIMVDHTFLYTSAVQKMKQLVDNGTVGTLQYFDSSRINLGLFQPDVNVLWDLAPHDISILNFLYPDAPYSVNATGVSHTANGHENVAYLTVNYGKDKQFVAHFNCSWTSPVKIRTLLLGGNEKMLVFNDLEPTEKIRVYDTGYSVKNEEDKTRMLVDYRVGDVYIPKLDSKEALAGMAADFVNSIKNGTQPLSSASLGAEVVRILEAAQISIKERGREVIL